MDWIEELLTEVSEAAWDAEVAQSLTVTTGADALVYKQLGMPPEMHAALGINHKAWIERGAHEGEDGKQVFSAVCPKPECQHESKLVAADIRLVIYPQGAASAYVCQGCVSTVHKYADAHIIDVLTKAGVEIVRRGDGAGETV